MDPEMLARLADRQAEESILGDRQARQWVVRVIALLLVVQALALLLVSGATGLSLNWSRELGRVVISLRVLDTMLLLVVLVPVAIFEIVTAFGLWLGHSSAWLRALIVQGLLLIYCLSSYISGRSQGFIYLLMLLCIVNVLYLNTNDIRLAFQSRRSTPRPPRA